MEKKIDDVLVPSILQFSDSSNFFKKLVSLNNSKDHFISGREISKKLNWPISLMVDIVKERRPLTPQRASEFGRFAKFNALELERLIWISLMETGDEHIRLFFKAKLDLKAEQVLLPTVSIVDAELQYWVDVAASVLMQEQTHLTATEIKERLNNKKTSLKKLNQALALIKKHEILAWDPKKKSFTQKKNFEYDNYNKKDTSPFKNIEIHHHYAKNFLEFIENPKLPSAYISGCITITNKQFMPIALQLFQIKNWLVGLSRENREAAVAKSDLRLMQLDLNFFKITK